MQGANHDNHKSVADTVYRVFSLTWPTFTQIYWKKESVCIRKEFNSHRTGLGHQHGRRFNVWGNNMAAVTSCEKRSVTMVNRKTKTLSNLSVFHEILR